MRLIKAGLEWAHIKADLPPGLAYRETRFIRAFRILSGITYTRRVQATNGVAPGEVARRKQTTGRAYPVRSAPGHIHMESLFFFFFLLLPLRPSLNVRGISVWKGGKGSWNLQWLSLAYTHTWCTNIKYPASLCVASCVRTWTSNLKPNPVEGPKPKLEPTNPPPPPFGQEKSHPDVYFVAVTTTKGHLLLALLLFLLLLFRPQAKRRTKMEVNHEGLARGRLLFRWACAALFSPAFPSLFDLWTLPLPWHMTNIFCRFVSCFKAVKDVH